jgi:tetratricopeptide (TPR) repeat protein
MFYDKFLIGKNLNFKFITIILMSFFMVPSVCADIQISLQPTPIVAGEPATLSIRSTEGKAEIAQLPTIEGVKWLQPDVYGSSIMIINGVHYETSTYNFIVNLTGLIKLPPLKIKLNNEAYNTKGKTIRVISGPLTDLEKYIYLKPEYAISDKKKIYVGEELPLKIYLYKAESISANPVEYPQIKLNGVIFENFNHENRDSERFACYPYDTPTKVNEDGVNYIKSCFYTSYRPIVTGKLKGTVSIMLDIVLPRKNRRSSFRNSLFDNDIFNNVFNSDSFFNRGKHISKMILAELPELEVMPLPEKPKDINYLGLLGEWKTDIAFSSQKMKEGEPLTIKITITGNGSLETLKTCEIAIPGFTTYPPDITKNEPNSLSRNQGKKATIDYVLIPTERGKKKIDISFATFEPETGKYDITKLNKVIEVSANKFSSSSTVYGRSSNDTNFKKYNKGTNKLNNAILYLDKNITSNVKVPLYKNNLILIIILFLLGPILWFLFILLRARNLKINKNSNSKRKYSAKKNYNKVIRAVKKSKPEHITEVMNDSILPFIYDIKGFAPGTTVDEVVKKISNKELIDCLKEINSSRYMPDKNLTNEQLKSKLYKCIKRMTFILAIGIFIALPVNMKGAETHRSNVGKMISFYNKGEFGKAAKLCKENIIPTDPNPIWLYNLANCYFQNGDLPRALVCYERALLLAPRNSDILENLNYVRSKLFLPEMYTRSTPTEFLEYMRDFFRPDEWILILSVCVFLIFIALILRYLTTKKIYMTLIIISIVLGGVSLIAFINQKYTIYNNKDAIVLYRDIDVYSLPSENSTELEFNLLPGEEVKVEENADNWVRIRTKKSEGWIKDKNVEQIWGY